jgi:hypothetical protein
VRHERIAVTRRERSHAGRFGIKLLGEEDGEILPRDVPKEDLWVQQSEPPLRGGSGCEGSAPRSISAADSFNGARTGIELVDGKYSAIHVG